MAPKHRNDSRTTGEQAIQEHETDPPRKTRRRSSVVSTLYSGSNRFDLNEVLVAIGFKDEAGDPFELLAKDWYAHFRPGRVLSTKEDGIEFNRMIVEFMIKYGPEFWPKDPEARGHLIHSKAPYRPAKWTNGECISFEYPRDTILRRKRINSQVSLGGGRIRNMTQAIHWEDQVNSFIHKALKPYFIGLHYNGRVPVVDDQDPEGFGYWSLSAEEVAECLEQLNAIPGPKNELHKASFNTRKQTTAQTKPLPQLESMDVNRGLNYNNDDTTLATDQLRAFASHRGVSNTGPGTHRKCHDGKQKEQNNNQYQSIEVLQQQTTNSGISHNASTDPQLTAKARRDVDISEDHVIRPLEAPDFSQSIPSQRHNSAMETLPLPKEALLLYIKPVSAGFTRKDSVMRDIAPSAPAQLSASAREELMRKKRLNEIEAETRKRVERLGAGASIVHENGR